MKPIQVAIADDSAVIRERLLQKLAQIEGIQMAWQAQSAAEAIAAFQRLKPEVAILDIQMPDGSGIEVLAHIKKESPQTTVIMLTNYPMPPFRTCCLKAGADYFFDKSTEFEKVFEVLKLKTTNDHQDSGSGEFETLTFPFMNRLYRTALILTGSPRLAKNLLHDACLKARHGRSRFHNDEDFGTWVLHFLFKEFSSLSLTKLERL